MSDSLPRNAANLANHARIETTALRSRRRACARILGSTLMLAGGTAIGQEKHSHGGGDDLAPVRLITKEDLRQPSVVRDISPLTIELEPLVETDSIPVVTALASDPSGSYLAIAGDDHAIRIYSTGQQRVIRTFKMHRDWIRSLQFAPVTDQPQRTADAAGKHLPPVKLFSGADDGLVYSWHGEAPVAIADFGFPIRSLSFSAEQNLLAIGGFNKKIVVFDVQNESFRHILECDCGDQRTVRFSPDGTKLLCGGRDGEVNVWETATGRVLAKYTAHRGRIFTAGFSSDGSKITSVGEDRRLVHYDLVAQNALPQSLELPAKLMSMCLINDSIVAMSGADNTIKLFDFAANDVIAELDDHEGTVAVMCRVGRMLASGSFDTTVKLWNLDHVEERRRLSGRPVGLTPLEVDEKLRIR